MAPSAHVVKLRKHFMSLLREVGATVRYTGDPEYGAFAEAWQSWSKERSPVRVRVYLPAPVSDTEGYFLGLHELGHLAAVKHSRGHSLRPTMPLLEREADAWQYALDNAIVPPSKRVWARIFDSLDSYRREYRNDRRVKPSATFDRLLKRARKEAT